MGERRLNGTTIRLRLPARWAYGQRLTVSPNSTTSSTPANEMLSSARRLNCSVLPSSNRGPRGGEDAATEADNPAAGRRGTDRQLDLDAANERLFVCAL